MRTISRPSTPFVQAVLATAVLAVAGLASAGEKPAAIDAQAAFEKLKALEGSWIASAEGFEETVDHEIRVTAAGSVVVETMMAGSDHEMVNMYHLDGEDLVVTHYCATGNQPTMRLDLTKATATELPFVFTGGTNIEETAHHIHDAVLTLREDGSVVAKWVSYAGGEPTEPMQFVLRRAQG